MSKLRDILIERMVGDMSKIFTFKNAMKPSNELYELAKPKLEGAADDIKTLMLGIVEESRDKSLPLAYIEKTIKEL